MKIAVVTDSGSGLTKKEALEKGIYCLPLQIIINDDMFLDGVDISVEEIYDSLRAGAMPTTSMPPMGLMEELFHELKKQGYDEVIAIPLTAGLSSTASVLEACAKRNEFKVHMVESYSTCNIEAYLATSAKTLVDQGLDAEEIVTRLKESIDSSNTLIVPDDLQHLKRGGRLTPLAAALGGLLKIKPLLQLNKTSDGKVDVFDKVRTMSKAQQKAIDTFVKDSINDGYMLTVLHSGAPIEGQKCKELMEDTFPGFDLTYGLIGAVISAHTGLGCVGIQYIKKVRGI